MSFYGYHRKSNIPDSVTFEDYLKALEQRDSRIFQYKPHYLPASDFLLDENDKSLVDTIVHFENRRAELGVVQKTLGIELGVASLNESSRPGDYRTAYTDKAVDIVYNVYKRDIDAFLYKF